jgi:hypothetical protein
MAEIPYPQAPEAPQFSQSNPLEMMSQMQTMSLRNAEMQRAQQAAAIQQQQFVAKQALGQLMQQHVDPKTGQLNNEQFLVHAATVPEIQPIMGDVMTLMLTNKHVEEQILGQQLTNAEKKLDVNANIMSAIHQERIRKGLKGPEADKQSAADFVAQQIAAGTLERGEPSRNALIQLTQAINSGQKFDDFARSMALSSPKARESLQAAGLTLGQLTAPVDTFDQDPNSPTYGQKIKVPAYRVQGAVPEGAADLMAGARDATQGGSAPPAADVARREPQPSGAPATQQFLQEAPVAAQREVAFQKGEGDYAKLGQEIGEAAAGAASSQQAITETRSLLRDIEGLGKSGTGPTAPMRKAAGKLLLDAENLVGNADPNSPEGKLAKWARGSLDQVAKVVTGSNDPKEWVGAAEAFEKLAAVTAIAGLRTAVGPSNKVTQQEVLKFMDLFPGLSSSPGGIKRMLNYMEKINDTAMQRQEHFNRYTKHYRTDRERGYVANKVMEDWNDFLKAKGRIKFEEAE